MKTAINEQNYFRALGFLRKTTNRLENLTPECTMLIYSLRVQFISLRVEMLIFYYSAYKIRALFLHLNIHSLNLI